MIGIAHRRGVLGKDQWSYNGKTGDGLEIYEHKENGRINIYDPKTGDMIDDN
ncbi:hypothetical protein [Brevibacillus laterosporus]|uniref:hypothetical protein n=1 Tax=Brevibacillus laterosporus TaxID=1465 RepID=UPI0013C48279|nr:hypothetical protein [Brevibacillus laterosporus]MBM7111344.1 hypothetical protein [Brevibacillus laterosporus]